jgi:hypothetical protein
MAMHASYSIIKFADDTTVVGLISNNDETAYMEEVTALGVWCQENNLSLNVIKKQVGSFNYRCVYITDKLKWSTHIDSVVSQHPMSQEGQKDHQGQQPPEPLPVYPAIIQKARSVQVHQSWDRETEKQLLTQLLNSHH